MVNSCVGAIVCTLFHCFVIPWDIDWIFSGFWLLLFLLYLYFVLSI
jgi:hypothetical protein